MAMMSDPFDEPGLDMEAILLEEQEDFDRLLDLLALEFADPS